MKIEAMKPGLKNKKKKFVLQTKEKELHLLINQNTLN
jgi:hypothetical protein